MQRDDRPVKPRATETEDSQAAPGPDPQLLIDLATMRMPFGRYRGRVLIDLPEPYVVWFRQQGYPKGRLGVLFATLYEVKANGLEPLVREVGRRAR